MREWKKKTGVFTLLSLLFVLLTVFSDMQWTQAAVKLNQTSVNLCVGDTMKLKLTGTSKQAKWKSSAKKIVKVSSKGTIRALDAGSATITATVGKKSYQCKVKVNQTFRVDETSIKIKKNKTIHAFLSVNGAVNASVADKKVCSVIFGSWEGDDMPLTIVPKKVGSTTIKFTNSANKEYCTLKVTVTALPVNAAFQTPTVNTGAELFIAGENAMSFAFQLDRAAKSAVFKLYDADGDVIRAFPLGAVAAKRTVGLAWDGRNTSGKAVSGMYSYAVVADGTKTVGGNVIVQAVSPFGKGDGTENNPFLVSNLAELMMVKNYNGAHFAQDAEIDFNYSWIAPLFDDTEPFVGTYDGSYINTRYQMSNLFGYNSVFGSIGADGVVKNVTMNNCVLNTTGSLLAFTNNGTIDNCSVNGNIFCNAGNQAALLVMYNKGQIRSCDVAGKLTVDASGVIGATALRAGGIAMNNAGTIAECTSTVELSQRMQIGTYVPNCAYEIYTGGIAAENAANGFVTQCTFTGSIYTQILLPDALQDASELEVGKIYSGYVAGNNQGYISRSINAGSSRDLTAQGTGTGMIQ